MRKLFGVVMAILFMAGSFMSSQAVLGCETSKGKMVAMQGKMAMKKSLYERLGGKKAIDAVVDAFVARVAADNRINKFFAKTAADPKRLARFKKNLSDQICMASGGPCKYMGKDMKTAHAGMGISGANFGALVEDLSMTLDKFKVGAEEKKELLGALGPMQKDIVEKK